MSQCLVVGLASIKRNNSAYFCAKILYWWMPSLLRCILEPESFDKRQDIIGVSKMHESRSIYHDPAPARNRFTHLLRMIEVVVVLLVFWQSNKHILVLFGVHNIADDALDTLLQGCCLGSSLSFAIYQTVNPLILSYRHSYLSLDSL